MARILICKTYVVKIGFDGQKWNTKQVQIRYFAMKEYSGRFGGGCVGMGRPSKPRF